MITNKEKLKEIEKTLEKIFRCGDTIEEPQVLALDALRKYFNFRLEC